MKEWKNRLLGRPVTFLQNQRGITGLETAIVLFAFVVVASVFSFAVLNTRLLSSEKSIEATLGGLEETSAMLSLRGQVIVVANTGTTSVDSVKFTRASFYRLGNRRPLQHWHRDNLPR
ncbi:MAG: hypothetical protein CME15_16340 [Gemmatimonadetes bacterium]|jgi:flagellin-like protein|nr:hypothetical protein [Gemmatimonadota bacterium]